MPRKPTSSRVEDSRFDLVIGENSYSGPELSGSCHGENGPIVDPNR
jgi:hypothetical protein